MLKGIIFDMDGVIVNSEVSYLANVQKFMKKYNYDISFKELMYAIGRSDRQIWKYFYGLLKQKTPNKLYLEFLEFEAKHLPSYKEIVIPEFEKLICRLKDLNLKYALASSSPMRRINEMLALNNFEKIFDYKVTGEAFKVSKPNPEIFLNAVENLGFTVEECLVIEDTTNGVLAANRANIQVIGYRHTEYIADLSTANYCISNLLEAEEIVRNLRK